MGLDTSHDAWHGSYGSFNNFRRELAKAAGITLDDMYGFNGNIQWDTLEPRPLHILLNHSDCDGEIPWEVCKDLADDLTTLLDKLPDANQSEFYPRSKEKAEQFIKGCLLAFKNKENIDFH